jgi:XisI protein
MDPTNTSTLDPDCHLSDREIIKQVIQRYAQFKPSHGDIHLSTLFDEDQDRYALMQSGWDRDQRISGNLIYITLHDKKIWIEYDGMEQGITQDLVTAGIKRDRIILAFLPEAQPV